MRRPRTNPLSSKSEVGDRSVVGTEDGGDHLPVHHPENRSTATASSSSSAASTVPFQHNFWYRTLRRWLTTERAKIGSAFLIGACLSSSFQAIRDGWRLSSSTCRISFGTYHGKVYDTASRVGSRTCLVESKFLKVQQHQVKLPGKGGDGPVIPDWLWIDYHDRINVLVQAPLESPSFLVFEQTKYALEGRLSLAIVGGIIEPGEEAARAAEREVREELGVDCRNFHFLGRYRTDVNRGMGWTNAFLASQCKKDSVPTDAENGAVEAEVVGAADSERQDVRTLSLSELKDAVQAGRFLEIQWSATVALALLHLENNSAPAVA